MEANLKDLTECPMPWWSVPFWAAVGLLWGGLILFIAAAVGICEIARTARRMI